MALCVNLPCRVCSWRHCRLWHRLLPFESIGQPVLQLYGYSAKFDVFRDYYNEWGAWAVFIAGISPFPYKVITILSGVTALDPAIFMVASVLARGLRFFIIAALIWKFGPVIRDFIERRLGLVLPYLSWFLSVDLPPSN